MVSQGAGAVIECVARPPSAGVRRTVTFKELLESWRERSAVPRPPDTHAVRLPVDDAARLAALAEMFPGRAPEQLITELLGVALNEIAAAMPYIAGKRELYTDEQSDAV